MVEDGYAVHLSKYCFNVCETLKDAIQGENQCGFCRSESIVMGDLARCARCPRTVLAATLTNARVMREIELSLRRRATKTPYKCDREEVEGHVRSIRQVVGALHTLNPSLCEDSSMDERAPHLMSVHLRNSTTIAVSENGTSPPSAFAGLCGISIVSQTILLDCNITARGRLIGCGSTLHEFPFMIRGIISNDTEAETTSCLPMGDAQILIDQLDDVRSASICHHKFTGCDLPDALG